MSRQTDLFSPELAQTTDDPGRQGAQNQSGPLDFSLPPSRAGFIYCNRCGENLEKITDHHGELPQAQRHERKYSQIIMTCPACIRTVAVIRRARTQQFCIDCGHIVQTGHGCGC